MQATLLLMAAVVLSGFFFWCGFEAPAELETDCLAMMLEKVRTEYELPALAAARISSAGIRDLAVEGVRRNDKQEKVLITDGFHLGSVTKSITALAIAHCVGEGKLTWESRPDELFSELEGKVHPDYGTVTLRALLHHSAGVPAYTGDGEFERAPVPPGTPVERRRAFTAWLLQQPPAGKPGSFLYSNAGYSIAAAMAEDACGVTWEQLVKEKVFEPLGLKTAGFGWPNKENPDQPWGHGSFSGSNQCWPLGPDHEWKLDPLSAPSGDVHMSIEDLAVYLQHHLRALSGEETVLDQKITTGLHDPVHSYGLGWFVVEEEGRKVSRHSGSAGTFLCSVAINPSRDIAVAFLSNVRTDGAADACRHIMKELMSTERCEPCRFLPD